MHKPKSVGESGLCINPYLTYMLLMYFEKSLSFSIGIYLAHTIVLQLLLLDFPIPINNTAFSLKVEFLP